MQYGNYNCCMKCGNPLKSGSKFCTRCGNDLRKNVSNYYSQNIDNDIDFQNRVKVNYYAKYGVAQENVKPVVRKVDLPDNDCNDNKPVGINFTNLIITAICAILWLVAPFEAINYLTLGDQPSAFQLLTDKDLFLLGELTETTAYWSALFSIIGITACFIATLAKSKGFCRDFGIVAMMPMLLTLLQVFTSVKESDDVEFLMGLFGFGYWAILILLFVLICNSGRKKRYG